MRNLEKLSKEIRINTLKMVSKGNASHIGSSLSIVDIITALYGSVMYYDEKNPLSDERDRFILSKGHGCAAVYATLAEFSFFDKEELNTFGNDFSWFMNHISHKVDGVEFSAGALGHGLPFGVGKSLAAKIKNQDYKTFVLLSDGEMDEGSNWEALMFASHHKLDNLVAIIDYNKLQSLDTIKNTLNLEPLHKKLESFGCEVLEIDGHNFDEIISSFKKSHRERPKVIIAHTTKGKGVSFMEDLVEWHYKCPTKEQLTEAINEIRSA